MTKKKSRPESNWGSTPRLSAEQVILWLDGYRQWMFEIWRSNPKLREKWLKTNAT